MNIKVGEKVTRCLGGINGVKLHIIVTRVTNDKIYCGPWKFDKLTGAELDKDLGWTATRAGSCILYGPETDNL